MIRNILIVDRERIHEKKTNSLFATLDYIVYREANGLYSIIKNRNSLNHSHNITEERLKEIAKDWVDG